MFRLKMIAGALMATTIAVPAQAAFNLGFANLVGAEYDTAGVFISGDVVFDGTTDDGAGFDIVSFDIYDDGALKFTATYQGVIGVTNVFSFSTSYPGLVGTSAPGVGLVLNDLPSSFSTYFIDPYFLPHYADPSQCQTNCGPVGGAVPEPATWAMLLMGFGLVGGALRSRPAHSIKTTFSY